MDENNANLCLECGEMIHGRADKKFCSYNCRNNYNNKLNGGATKYMRKITNILRRNRRLLHDLCPDGKNFIAKDDLIKMGFSFHYFTSIYQTKKGTIYKYCFDYGYLEMDTDKVLVVLKMDDD